MPIAISSAIIPEIGRCFGISGDCDHIQAYGADTGHGFQLFQREGAGGYSVYHALILR